ncbi:Eukaryotic aspartyl protease [Aphelenchoides bicaudatus]|nr:Eukaryotic aspartyl protease [Aphelenchoides bicaudatus]
MMMSVMGSKIRSLALFTISTSTMSAYQAHSKKDGEDAENWFGSASFQGKLEWDDVTIAGITIKQQLFIDVDSMAEVFGYFPIDGTFGLGWQSMAIDDVVPPFFNMIPQLDQPIFTTWLDRHIKPAENAIGGQITFGAFDSDNCDADITYAPLTQEGYWQYAVDSFSFGKYANKQPVEAISDTGTSFIYGPVDDVDQIIAITSATYDFTTGLYTVPCDAYESLPDLVFKVNGKNLNVPLVETIVDLELGNGTCALGVDYGFGFEFDWLLGDSFLRTFCHVFDAGNKRVGFAKAHHSEV